MSSSSAFIGILDVDSPEDHDMTPLSPPSKVAYSTSQNPLRSTTPGYRETDIQLLTMEAGIAIPNSPTEEREVSTYPDAAERKRELYRQIACSYSAFTLYVSFGSI
jgi:hypothetical protein